MKKRRKKRVIWGIILALIIISLTLTIFYFATRQAMLTDVRIGLQYKNVTFNEISVSSVSTYFGTETNSDTTDAFCGNDGDVTISNSISGGDELSISSSIKGNNRKCGGNGVEATFTVPVGTIYGSYSMSAYQTKHDPSDSYFSIKQASTILFSKETCARQDQDLCKNPTSASGDFELSFSEPTELVIMTSTSTGDNGGSSVSLNIGYMGGEIEVTIYRLENNQCNAYVVLESEVLDTDYSSLELCELDMLECIDDSNCETDYECIDNVCVEIEPIVEEPECEIDNDCESGYECSDGICIEIEEEPDCEYFYWIDDVNKDCEKKEFCGTYMYNGLQVFQTKEECEDALDGKDILPIVLTISIFIIIAIMVILVIYGLVRKKKRRKRK